MHLDLKEALAFLVAGFLMGTVITLCAMHYPPKKP